MVIRAFAVVALVAVACAGLASAAPRPAKPRVLGPRRTADRTPTFRFVSSERGLPGHALRFRCALGAARFHSCPRRYTPTLRFGRHLLRVIAVDPRGRRSPTTTIVVRVVKRPAGPARADQTFRIGGAPYNVAYGLGSLWVTVERALLRLDPVTGAVQARVEVGGRPWSIAIAESVVWVGNLLNETIAAVEPRTNTLTRRIVLDGAAPVGVAVGGGALWAANNDDDRVWRLDPATGAILSVAHVGDSHEFVGYSEGRVWVASEDGTIAQLDAVTGAVTKTIATGSDADYLGFSPGSVWVSNYASPFLWRIDAASGTIAQRLLIGYGAQGVEDDGSTLWVAMYRTGFVLQVDRATGAIRKRFEVGRKPRGLTIALGSVWVANSASDTISRIGLSR
jgi:DNA-binding beta-propeller fold protein YncE